MNNGLTHTNFVLAFTSFCMARWVNIVDRYEVRLDGENIILAKTYGPYLEGTRVGKLAPHGVTVCGRDRFSMGTVTLEAA